MIRIEKYHQDMKAEWNAFNKAAKNPLFMFDRDFMEYHSDRFADGSFMFYDDDELVALLPCNVKENALYSHGGLTFGGFIVDRNMKQHRMNDCVLSLKNYMGEEKIEKIVYKAIPYIYANQHAQEDLYSLFLNGGSLAKVEPSTVVNLRNPIKMPKGRKAQVSRAKREGVEMVESEDFASFIGLENSVLQKRHGKNAVHTGEELSLLHGRFPENIKLYVAMHRKRMLAGAVLFVYDDVVHTQYLAADDTAREIGALDLVVAALIEKYGESKTYFDFGISSEGEDGRLLNEGLIHQKEGFGGRTVVYQTWEMRP